MLLQFLFTVETEMIRRTFKKHNLTTVWSPVRESLPFSERATFSFILVTLIPSLFRSMKLYLCILSPLTFISITSIQPNSMTLFGGRVQWRVKNLTLNVLILHKQKTFIEASGARQTDRRADTHTHVHAHASSCPSIRLSDETSDRGPDSLRSLEIP